MHSLLVVHATQCSSVLGAQQLCLLYNLTELPLHASQVGLTITGISFIRKYASDPSVNICCTGGEVTSSTRREELAAPKMSHIESRWVLVLGLKGFVFFGIAESVTARVRQRMSQEEEEKVTEARMGRDSTASWSCRESHP